MRVTASLFGLIFKLLKKFLLRLLGSVVISVLIGTALLLTLCSAKYFCIKGTLSWVSVEFFLFAIGLGIGVYDFMKYE